MDLKLRFPAWLAATRKRDRVFTLSKMSDSSIKQLRESLEDLLSEVALEQARRKEGLKQVPAHLVARIRVSVVDPRLWRL